MKKKISIDLLLTILLTFGLFVAMSNNEYVKLAGDIVYALTLMSAAVIFIFIALFRRLFTANMYRDYVIKKGNHYANILPIFKPHIVSKDSIYQIRVKLYKGWFKKPSKVFSINDRIQILNQVNKLFGFNYGLPRIDWRRFKLVHKNSIRAGIKLGSKKDIVQVHAYMRDNDFIYSEHIGDIDWDNVPKYIEIRLDLDKGYIWMVGHEDSKVRFFKELVTKKKYGYFLSKPYFGGKAPAITDLALTMITNKV